MYGLNVHGMRMPPLSVPVLARFSLLLLDYTTFDH